MKKKNPLVSVVTPFYNTEDYLSECIESVLNQSYDNFEYILVNNCSTDNSKKIVCSYASKDKRIRIFNNDRFLTQVQNYNFALENISYESKYCKIVQADDWIFPECLQKMIDIAEISPKIGIVGAYRLDDIKVNCDGLPYTSKVFKGHELCRSYLMGEINVFGSPTSTLIRSDIVRKRNPFYNENSWHADTEACYEILLNFDFGFVHQVLTFTRRENESISSIIRRFDPYYLLEKFTLMIKYGRNYLDKNEYKRYSSKVENYYYKFIGKNILKFLDTEFASYHKRSLKNVNYHIRPLKLLLYTLIMLADSVLNPKRTLTVLIKKIISKKRLFEN